MKYALPKLDVERKTGHERFCSDSSALDFSALDV